MGPQSRSIQPGVPDLRFSNMEIDQKCNAILLTFKSENRQFDTLPYSQSFVQIKRLTRLSLTDSKELQEITCVNC